MANEKVSALTELAAASVAADDYLYAVDTSAGTSGSKKIRTDGSLDALARIAAAGGVLMLDATGEKLIVRRRGGTPGTAEGQLSNDTNMFILQGMDSAGISLRGNGSSASLNMSNGGGSILRYGAGNYVECNSAAVIITGGTTGQATVDATGLTLTGWLKQTSGVSRVNTASPVTNATDTMAAITGLSATLIAGRKYAGTLSLFVSTDAAAEGIKFDFGGGAATMTAFNAAVTGNVQAATAGVTVSAALATDITFTSLTGTSVNCIVISFDLVCNAAGTLIPRFSQVAHAVGTATVVAANMLIQDIP